ncbi:TetR/AcrR family transcriptional regulator [uncultured Tolumonas sp.]|uniref:TetR/AcrR family transcriptional regulator n=1 Tax=uncultured Tolumonas sp. TaxID=263765 RepID=UPI00292D9A00|nr:TetR/AcrR family transcriptional regulator [uncultured Tolumonas sp.]
MRRDAVERRARLLDAAETEFTQRGINIPLESVAERAGVGIGTFYRNFPDRQALLDALLDRSLARMENQLIDDEKAKSVYDLIEHIAESLVMSPVLSEYWRSTGKTQEAANLARDRFIRIADRCLKAEPNEGHLRSDIVAEDFLLISSMLGGILCGRDMKEREKIKERVLSFLYTGILKE